MTNEELAIAIKKGDQGLIETLWKQCYRFIRKRATKHSDKVHLKHIDEEDLIQCGYFALCKAIQRFDPEKGSFITLLGFMLKTEFQTACGSRTSRRDPLNYALSLDTLVFPGSNDDLLLIDTIPSEVDYIAGVDDSMLADQFSVYVRNAVSHLPDKQRTVIEHHFFQGMTYESISRVLSLSPQRCKQLATEAIIRLRTGRDAAAMITLDCDRVGNVLKGTGYTAWKETGCSVQEKTIIRMDEKEAARERKIQHFVGRGMPREKAELLFPV